MIKEIKIYNSY